MNLFRLQNNTPPIYTDESRDFQLFCRLYDCVNAGTKFDVDQITGILNAFTIRNNLLPLLQTKLGFFTNKRVDDLALRYILDAFPDTVRKKGSLKGIQQAVNTFLKVYGIRTEVVIFRYDGEEESEFAIQADDHTIIVAMNSAVKDMSILEEVFKYIFPTGFGFQFFFYSDVNQMTTLLTQHKVHLLFVSDNINSMIRREFVYGNLGNEPTPYTGEEDEFVHTQVGAVDTVHIASTDSKIPD